MINNIGLIFEEILKIWLTIPVLVTEMHIFLPCNNTFSLMKVFSMLLQTITYLVLKGNLPSKQNSYGSNDEDKQTT